MSSDFNDGTLTPNSIIMFNEKGIILNDFQVLFLF